MLGVVSWGRQMIGEAFFLEGDYSLQECEAQGPSDPSGITRGGCQLNCTFEGHLVLLGRLPTSLSCQPRSGWIV